MARLIPMDDAGWAAFLADAQRGSAIHYDYARDLYAKRVYPQAIVYQRVAANKWLRVRSLIDNTHDHPDIVI